MSAVPAMLPVVWGYAAPDGAVNDRKGPQRLVLVGVSALQDAAQRLRALNSVEVAEPGAVAEPPSLPRAIREALPVELAFYRKYTEALLRRYVRLSMEAGRTPSLLGREMFRGKVTSYQVKSFDDVVIFVHDVGQCLAKLDSEQQYVIRRIALQEYTQDETAEMSGQSQRSICRRYTETLDKLTRLFLERDLLQPLSACQEGDGGLHLVNDTIE